MARRYQPFYCEENIWWLCESLGASEAAAVTVIIMAGSGELGELEPDGPSLLMWEQRAAEPGEALLWDYHVAAWERRAGLIWDLDSRLSCPCPAREYLARSFPHSAAGIRRWAPRFRLVPAAVYLAELKTDRRHMRGPAGGLLAPPPAWDPPGAPGSNLEAWVDLRGDGGEDDGPGERVDFATLWRRTAPGGQVHEQRKSQQDG